MVRRRAHAGLRLAERLPDPGYRHRSDLEKRHGLARAGRRVGAKQAAGWQIVYLAAKAETPVAYAKEREWLQEQTAAVKDPLVSGPVLARRTLFENQLESAARKAILADLKGEFGGQVYYITANPELMLEPVGDQTGVRLKGWKNLVEILPK